MKVFLNNDILTQVEGIKNLLSHNALKKVNRQVLRLR